MRLNLTRAELEFLALAVEHVRLDRSLGAEGRLAMAELGDKVEDALARYDASLKRLEARNPKDLKRRCHQCGGSTAPIERGADVVWTCTKCKTPGKREGKAK